MGELEDKVVLVTGAAGGLGRAMAERFRGEGAKIVIADIKEEDGTRTASSLAGRFHRLDITSEADWIGVIEAILHTHGRLDVLVNNAGVFRHNIPFLETPLEVWREHMTVNCDGVFLGCKHGIPAMARGGGGAIINMSSMAALMALTDAAAYSASKAAILSTTRIAARVGGPLGVRVNAILPGLVLTGMSRSGIPGGLTEDEYVAQVLPMYPVGRIGLPDDIAEAALFLASPRSSFISGHLLRVDGAQDP